MSQNSHLRCYISETILKEVPALSTNGELQTNVTDFQQLFRSHYPVLCRLLTGILGRSAAEDVAQEAFIKLYTTPPGEFSNIRGWLTKVAMNIAYNHLRSEKNRLKREARAGLVPGVTEPETEVLRKEQAELTRIILEAMPKRDRAYLVLRFSGMNYSEIAATLGVRESSVGTLLARARAKFKAEYIRLKGGEENVL